MKMNRTLLALALAAIVPPTLAIAGHNGCPPSPFACDRNLETTIVNLEKYNWEIGRTHDVAAARKFYTHFCYEIVAGGVVISKEELLAGISGNYDFEDLTFSDFKLFRVSDTVVSLRYRIVLLYLNYDVPEISGTYDVWVTSTYSLVKGCWKIRIYQETLSSFVPLAAP